MPDGSFCPSEAIVICTRNRPDALEETLRSVADQSGAEERLVLVVDGSDDPAAKATTRTVESSQDTLPIHYHRYPGPPAGTRQRNAGVDLLPASVSIVHFVDDDVTLKTDYFDILAAALNQHPSLFGVGGIIESEKDRSPPSTSLLHQLFLLSTTEPSRVLPSGQTTQAWSVEGQILLPAEWLSTCASSYRRFVFEDHRFDPAVEGPSPRLEDLDFSYRVAQDGPLAVAPKARCVHHVSPTNRRDLSDTGRERAVRRYWFVEKNLSSLPHRLAFWWSMLGKLLILLLSSNPDSREALRGLLRGLRTIWSRNHDLLRGE